jgi:PAS domain-containing protein
VAAHPIELILARNLVSNIKLAALLLYPDGVIVFFNDAAGDLVGRRFEEVGPLSREAWSEEFGPFDEFGAVVPTDGLPVTVALREGLPATDRVRVRFKAEELLEIEVSALPLTTVHGFQGALVVFWPAAVAGP